MIYIHLTVSEKLLVHQFETEKATKSDLCIGKLVVEVACCCCMLLLLEKTKDILVDKLVGLLCRTPS